MGFPIRERYDGHTAGPLSRLGSEALQGEISAVGDGLTSFIAGVSVRGTVVFVRVSGTVDGRGDAKTVGDRPIMLLMLNASELKITEPRRTTKPKRIPRGSNHFGKE